MKTMHVEKKSTFSSEFIRNVEQNDLNSIENYDHRDNNDHLFDHGHLIYISAGYNIYMRKDQNCPNSRIDDNTMSTFPHVT